ncbi:MBL fold metallo-hydrolase [Poseidonocella sp. HB161398]|uniref:MBL fold metallo-hydrolase n=1 Tax=Poseidonocella sp. HB161398 TaxID=2320855 RepID=UPI001109D9CF|nr:MBL fold metallo-hydrolase [Poseidonocella sp. HB161398]
MKITFHGAAGEVTGSCHLVECAGKRILVDCGMFQGRRDLRQDNAAPFGFEPRALDLVLLTHAHLDHCGRLPLLAARGFDGEIVSTPATADLARLVMMDAAHLQEEDARRDRLHGDADAEPLYDTLDALDAVDLFGRKPGYGERLELFPGIAATYFPAGHILGSASILLELEEEGRRRRVLFSGDIGPEERPLLDPASPPGEADVVVMESTYGDRDHRAFSATVAEFHAALRRAIEHDGNVIIPTFALERAQELLWVIRQGIETDTLPADLPVYLDSPMAISATRIFRRHPDAMRADLGEALRAGRDPFRMKGLHFVREARDSMELNRGKGGKVIMAGSGMCTGGRVRHHLRHNLGNPESHVIFVGFAAEGTLARIIIDGAREVKLFGQAVPVRARIHTINGFSAHAGASELARWHARTGTPSRTFLVHGEPHALEALARRLSPARTAIPKAHESFTL